VGSAIESGGPRTYGVSRRDKEPLLRFIIKALEGQGCRVIHCPAPNTAPFRITFETPQAERLGVLVYPFFANNELIKNRPADEHRFQIKLGGDLTGLHEVWQDPFGLYVTVFVGINPERGFFVAADPVIHNPTRFSVSVEFKDADVEQVLKKKWHAWEREHRGGTPHPSKKRSERVLDEAGTPLFEVLVGGTAESFLRLVRFEREALGEVAGERHYLADHFGSSALITTTPKLVAPPPFVTAERLHALSKEFELPEKKVLDIIAERRMLKMAVRGSVAEEHLLSKLKSVPGVKNCRRLNDDRGPDVGLTYCGKEITVECKNSSRVTTREGYEKIDLQRTRAAKGDFCSRYYKTSDFDLVAACLHAVTEKWEFKYAVARALDPHGICKGRLSNNVKCDERWSSDPTSALVAATS
jgi:hypothetical protein